MLSQQAVKGREQALVVTGTRTPNPDFSVGLFSMKWLIFFQLE